MVKNLRHPKISAWTNLQRFQCGIHLNFRLKMLAQFSIVCTLCLSTSLVFANNAFFIGARRHKPRWQGHPLTITGGYAPYQEDYHPDLSPYKYIYRWVTCRMTFLSLVGKRDFQLLLWEYHTEMESLRKFFIYFSEIFASVREVCI